MSGRCFDAVVFDLDGTLVDSASAIQAIGGRFLAECGAKPLTIEETRAFVGRGSRHFVTQMLQARGLLVDGSEAEGVDVALARFLELYAQGPGEDNKPFPGVNKTLSALAEADMRLAICTNKPLVPTWRVLDAHGWRALFDVVIDGDSTPTLKPDPRPLLAAIDALGAARNRVLFVGDSEIDRETAAAAGVSFALCLYGYRTAPIADLAPDYVLADFSALPALMSGAVAAASQVLTSGSSSSGSISARTRA